MIFTWVLSKLDHSKVDVTLYRDYKGKIPRDEFSALFFFSFLFLFSISTSLEIAMKTLTTLHSDSFHWFTLPFLLLKVVPVACALDLFSFRFPLEKSFQCIFIIIFFYQVYHIKCNAMQNPIPTSWKWCFLAVRRSSSGQERPKTTQLMRTFLCDRCSQWIKPVSQQGRQNTAHTGSIRIKESRSSPLSLYVSLSFFFLLSCFLSLCEFCACLHGLGLEFLLHACFLSHLPQPWL